MEYREEKTFTLRFSIEARFDDEEDAPDDGYAWTAEWERKLKPAVIRAVFDAVRAQPGWEARTRSRGASPDDEVEVVVERARTAK